MSERVPRAETQARTRERLLSAAAGLFADRGVNGTSIEQIAERAGYTRGAFYGHFAGKPEVVAALLAERTRHEYDELRELPADRLRAWHQERSAHTPEWLALRLELLLYAAREGTEVRTELRDRERFARQAHEGWLAELFADGSAPADLDQLALIVHALEDGLLIQRALDPDAVPPEAVVDAVTLLARAWVALARNPQD
ncbi:TetR family transcriptional regulator [Kribbella amoyensis]|uniref:TetR family transcriptional regulator n=1 Tax=Kribbella amoyensis TaxID=996641 RepID=A0A561BNB7_9ACTN|nr:TetR/AcrR family transcriptional regulator [Kribbella amoyensis]TWD80303.1 TetR family transcriptional regulator [Kribbella amoyensis]